MVTCGFVCNQPSFDGKSHIHRFLPIHTIKKGKFCPKIAYRGANFDQKTHI